MVLKIRAIRQPRPGTAKRRRGDFKPAEKTTRGFLTCTGRGRQRSHSAEGSAPFALQPACSEKARTSFHPKPNAGTRGSRTNAHARGTRPSALHPVHATSFPSCAGRHRRRPEDALPSRPPVEQTPGVLPAVTCVCSVEDAGKGEVEPCWQVGGTTRSRRVCLPSPAFQAARSVHVERVTRRPAPGAGIRTCHDAQSAE